MRAFLSAYDDTHAHTHLRRVAYFISPHGFGHAARAAAIMAAMLEINPAIRFEIFTQVPRWFFAASLPTAFGYHDVLTDIGLVQQTAFIIDLPATLQRLHDFLPFRRAQVAALAKRIDALRCTLLICDIAPLGIVVAKETGIPSVLIENFTWDWIYQAYVTDDSRIAVYIDYLQEVFGAADYHIQTEPVCSSGSADLTTPPVSRKRRMAAMQIRDALAIPHEAKMVMITMGGIPGHYRFVPQLEEQQTIFFLLSGVAASMQRHDNVVLLPHHSAFFHPDLVNACDAVIGKAGYSTVAEVYHAGVPFGYVVRQKFRESHMLAAYIAQQMHGVAISPEQFSHCCWISRLSELLRLPRLRRNTPNGADRAAQFLYQILLTQGRQPAPRGDPPRMPMPERR